MRISCPHCGADEGRCPEVLPACRARGDAARRLYALANGSEAEALRAENEALRAELDRIARERLVVVLPRTDRPRP